MNWTTNVVVYSALIRLFRLQIPSINEAIFILYQVFPDLFGFRYSKILKSDVRVASFAFSPEKTLLGLRFVRCYRWLDSCCGYGPWDLVDDEGGTHRMSLNDSESMRKVSESLSSYRLRAFPSSQSFV
ncbi:hypothetical protein LOAG_04359 [Loa loa]|uniref:DUF4283 domain-containing protein n=1 Tax=Loa loa TaxID=7209 RepID=A0A1I7W4S7_LOALO|nr:hypothetical protein LOAG_04359 [Loa loa]EFO24126.1 hypothetical protein LOAG_04359 [Loa loa]